MTDEKKLKKIKKIIISSDFAVMILELMHKDDLNGKALADIIHEVSHDILEVIDK